MAIKFPKPFLITTFMDNVSNEILDLCSNCRQNGRITLAQYKALRINSYEAKFIERYLDHEAFAWKIENAMKQVRDGGPWHIPVTYDEYLSTDGVKELLRRFKEIKAENMAMYSAILDAANLGSTRAQGELNRIARKDAADLTEHYDENF